MTGQARLVLLLAALVLAALIWVRPTTFPLPGAIAGKVGRIVIEKAARRMTLRQGDRPLREYSVALGFAPEGDLVIARDLKQLLFQILSKQIN